MGIPSSLSSLVLLIISDAPPYDVSVGIIDTDIWITGSADDSVASNRTGKYELAKSEIVSMAS